MKLQDNDLKSKYDECSDDELIEMLRDGDLKVTEYLLDKYKNLVKSKARSMHILGADQDDLIQEGMIGLFKAIRDYDLGRDASFSTFANLCVSRQIYTAVSASGRNKHMPLNTYISFYSTIHDEDGEALDVSLEDTLIGENSINPESMLISKETVEEIERWIEDELSGLEKQALELYLTGMGYVEIAKVLGRDEKSTDNALNRAKNKIKKLHEERQKGE